MRASSCIAVFALFLGISGVAQGAPSDADRARDELEKGYALRKEGKCGDALPLLADSYALVPQLKTLINLADCEENLGKLTTARAHWAKALDEAKGKSDAAISDLADKHLAAVEKRTPKLTIALAPTAATGATVSCDGATIGADELGTPRWVDPGDHTLLVQAPGTKPAVYARHLDEGARVSIQVTSGPSDAPNATATVGAGSAPKTTNDATLRTLGWTAIGVGAASIVVGAFFGVEAMSKKSDANCPGNSCANGGDPDALRSAVKDGNLSTLFFVAGGALAAGGIALLLVAPHDEGAPRASVSFAPNGVVLGGAF